VNRKALSLTLVLAMLLSAVAVIQTVDGLSKDNPLASVPIQDQHFVVGKAMGMFAVATDIGSFKASTGYWVEFDISVNSNDPYKREVRLEIASANHGVVFKGTGNKLNETVTLEYNDIYNLTIFKHAPFYTTIWTRGTIDVYHLSPKISITSIENESIYRTPNINLDFVTSESITNNSYSLDGKENVTFAENTTLSGLSNGKHNVTVYSWDFAGNSGASETIYFNVAESFPAVSITVASVIVVAVVCAALLVYYKKYKIKAKTV
jgi:hypothetical protein